MSGEERAPVSRTRHAPLDADALRANSVRAAALLKAMSNPARLIVLCQLAEGEKSVGDLEQIVGLSQSGLSQHLAVLRHERIVATRRVAQTIFYSLAGNEARAIMDTLFELFCSKAARPARPASRVRVR
ncbi:MAG: ArsR/SmtB family transcription factor [Burkholderiales bacterium]